MLWYTHCSTFLIPSFEIFLAVQILLNMPLTTSIKHWFKPVESNLGEMSCVVSPKNKMKSKNVQNSGNIAHVINETSQVNVVGFKSSNTSVRQMTFEDLREADSAGVIKLTKSIRIEGIYSLEDLLKKCADLNITLNPVPCHMDELKRIRQKDNSTEEGEYEVEEIIKCRTNNGITEYRIKWKGWSSNYNTWERLTNLKNCLDIVEQYHINNNIDQSGNKRKRETINDIKATKKAKIENLISELVERNDFGSLLQLRGLKASAFQGQNVTKLAKETKQILKTQPLKKGSLLDQLICTKNGLFDEFLIFVEKREETLKTLKKSEDDINKLLAGSAKIKIENNVDLEVFPYNFTYITDYQAAEGIIIPNDPPVGCECINCYDERKSCCASQSLNIFAYSRFGTLNVEPGTPIYECNRRCKCGPDCLNRVVQKGRQIELSIYRTDNGCGWGVKTLEKIKKGSFVMEYVGEVITNEEADKRGKIYDASGRTYLFDLDYDDSDCLYTVDAAFYGNVAHFMNHSCDPNLVVYGVWINNLDPKLPRLAFFAKRDIKKGEDLNFDYTMSTSGKGNVNDTPYRSPKNQKEDKSLSIECKCGTDNCKGYVF